MSQSIIDKLLEEDEEKIDATFLKLGTQLENAYKAGIYKEKNFIRINEPAKTDIEALEPFEREILNNFLIPNYIYDEAKTKKYYKMRKFLKYMTNILKLKLVL